MNFQFSINSNFGNHGRHGNKLTAQQEYWLDRILRNHSTQIFIVVISFIILIASTVIYSIINPETTSNNNSSTQKIEINGSKIIITQ